MFVAVWPDFLTCPKALSSAHVELNHSWEHLCSWKCYHAQDGPSVVAASAQVSLDLGSRYFYRENEMAGVTESQNILTDFKQNPVYAIYAICFVEGTSGTFQW